MCKGDLCKNCGLCCKLIPIDSEIKNLLRDDIQPIEDKFAKNLIILDLDEAKSINENYVNSVLEIFPDASFCRCKYLSKLNLCTNRNKPEFCIQFPSSPLAFVQDECGFSGEVFVKKEALKQKIRKFKEEIVYYEALIASGDNDSAGYQKIIHSLNRYIEKYRLYGSHQW